MRQQIDQKSLYYEHQGRNTIYYRYKRGSKTINNNNWRKNETTNRQKEFVL